MAFNSVTRLRLRSVLLLPAFARQTRAIAVQAGEARGFLGGAILAEGWMVFWTRTAWNSEAAMRAFRDGGAHGEAMPKLLDWCDEARTVHWQGEAEADWDAIFARIEAEGRASKLRRPNKNHAEGRVAPMRRWSPEQPIASTAGKNVG